MPVRKADNTSKPTGRKPAKRSAPRSMAAAALPQSMVTGKASPAKPAVGDKPVFAYIASLPQPQRGIAERVDTLAARTLPGLQRCIKWGMSYYGVGDGWCFCCGGFAGHVKLMFVNGATLSPIPPVTPVAMGKSTRGVELRSLDDLDESQLAAWMIQVAALPGVGGKKREYAEMPTRKSPPRARKPRLLAGGNPQVAKADGDAPVQAYVAAIPGWKRDVARRLDQLISSLAPGARKAVRWNSAMYGMPGKGWFVSFHVFTHYVKLTFFAGTSLVPPPSGGSAKEARWINIGEQDMNEAQLRRWLKQAAALPGWGKNG